MIFEKKMNSFFEQSLITPICLLAREIRAREIRDIQAHGFTSYVTDPEGDYQKFRNRLQQNNTLISELKSQYPKLKNAKINYVFGGDMTDKGEGNIEILDKVKELQRTHNVQLLIGDRDHNKIRFKEALNPKFRTHFHKLDEPYGYISGWNCSPKKYLKDKIVSLAEQFHFSLEGKSLEEKWNNIPQAKQTLCILQYLCEKTMGAPGYIQQL